ncbi:MAG: YraN family protein [Planctomycetota bacterium]|nr:YraN family protein [Planctomycetota bacterium]
MDSVWFLAEAIRFFAVQSLRRHNAFLSAKHANVLTGKELSVSCRVFCRALGQQLWLNPLTLRFHDWLWPPAHLGLQGERAAERYLRKRGYLILAEQYSNHYGEIDLIATRNETIVFVEVKTRRSDWAGQPAEAVDDVKQSRLTRAALAYLRRHELLDDRARFDVISVLWPDDQKTPRITHFENAFQAIGKFQLHG